MDAPQQNKAATVLIVDDDAYVRESLNDVLSFSGYCCLEAGDGKEAVDLIFERQPDLVLLDLRLPRLDGLEVLKRCLHGYPDMPVIMISGQGTIELAVEATKLGAFDFIEKPLEAERILLTIRNALDKSRLQKQRDQLLAQARKSYRLVGESPQMREIAELIERAAAVDSKVLITGESGTGKELVARGIHYLSARSTQPFVPVNCSAIPETLIESELFGHGRGAFTGAVAAYKGKFLQANHGTLFLDEIGEMDQGMQSKLLRAIEEKRIYPLGSEKFHEIDVRVMAATHQDLYALIESGQFRQDLFYRINVIHIHLPPLRERLEDIQPLAEYFLAETCLNEGLPQKYFLPEVWPLLKRHPWPGNVRELRNIVERSAVLHYGLEIGPDEVYSAMQRLPGTVTKKLEQLTLREARAAFEREFIRKALNAHGGKIIETARALGIQRSHLWKKIKQLGIESDDH